MTDDTPPNTGPSDATLNWLRANMKGMAEGLAKKSLVGKGKPVKNDSPKKWCGACGVGFDYGPPGDDPINIAIETGTCPECQAKLDSGMCCFTDMARYAFCIPTEEVKDFAGHVVQVSPRVLDEMLRVMAEREEKRTLDAQSGAA